MKEIQNILIIMIKQKKQLRLMLTFTVFIISVLACSTRSQKDYVNLSIPEELLSNEEVVEKLQGDADRLNNIFNSMDDFMEDIVSIKEEISEYDTADPSALLRARLSLKVAKIQASQLKIAGNVAWFGANIIMNSDTTFPSTLNNSERALYENCRKNIKIDDGLLDKRLEEIGKDMSELSALMDEKFPSIEEKMENEARADSIRNTSADTIAPN